MKTWQIYLLAAIIVVGGIGLMLWAKVSTNKVSNSNESAQQQNGVEQQTNANVNTESTNNNQSMEEQATENKSVIMTVKGYGDIKIELFEQDAPKAVQNFIGLTEKGYYNGVRFHRIIPGFVVQGGDPTGTGSGGESFFGKDFEDELNPNTESYKTGYVKGVVAMANRGPNTNSSQFFICLTDLNQSLGKAYTIFGKVVSGMDIVDKIAAKGSASGTPSEAITIEKAVTVSQ